MEQMYVLIVVGLTSVGTYIFGIKGLRLSRMGFKLAIGKACECVGLTLVFFVLNLLLGMGAILGVRALSGQFISIYIASDSTMLVLALLQALIFHAWREGSRQHYTSESQASDLFHREPYRGLRK